MNITQKEEFRYQYAGMAMQAHISNKAFMKNLEIEFEKRKNDIPKAVAAYAVDYADALIDELEKGKEGGRQ